MNDIIRRIEISGFRSLDSVQIICDSVNVFTGLNDVGKSNVLRALNLFFNDKTDINSYVNFNADYSKLSLAKAQKSSKKKQQIKIKVFFKAPASFKSLQYKELWVEKTYDRLGASSIRSSLDDEPQRASLTRLLKSIKYYYIPALKGEAVLEFLLGEIGERNLLPQDDIVELNRKVNDNIRDFATILSWSSIDIKTNFELPILVKDFWQGLNINTEFDEFTALSNVAPSKKGKDIKLREEFYKISLQARGEGIKSKYIPPLLKWIQEHEPNKYFIWGIDEPENSLEFKKAQEVADLYFNRYAINTQIFLTSHSLAFMFPSTANQGGTVFRCVKTGNGDVTITPLDTLFAEQDKLHVADELGALEIQKEVVKAWRDKENESNAIAYRLREITRPVIYVEGSIDKEYWDKTLDVFDMRQNCKFDVQPVGCINADGSESGMGYGGLDKLWQLRYQSPKGKVVVLFYDVDCKKRVIRELDVVIYCPPELNGQVYKKGIEHLLNLPTNFIKENYERVETNGDNTIRMPDKNKIRDYVFSLSSDDQMKCLQNLHDTIIKLEADYL